jgi:hypothetical protein
VFDLIVPSIFLFVRRLATVLCVVVAVSSRVEAEQLVHVGKRETL